MQESLTVGAVLHVLVHKDQPNADGAGSDWQLASSNDCAVFVNQR